MTDSWGSRHRRATRFIIVRPRRAVAGVGLGRKSHLDDRKCDTDGATSFVRSNVGTPTPTASNSPEFRAATIAAVAAIVGALIGVVGTAVPAFLVADRQIQAEREQSRADFLRDQQHETYARFLTDYGNLVDATYGADALVDVKSADMAALDEVLDNLDTSRAKVGESLTEIQLIGSAETLSLTETMMDHYNTFYWAFRQAKTQLEMNPQGDIDSNGLRGDVHFGMEVLGQEWMVFAEHARTDLTG